MADNSAANPVPSVFTAYARGLDETKVFDSEGNEMKLVPRDDEAGKAGWQQFEYKGKIIGARRDANAPLLNFCTEFCHTQNHWPYCC